MTCHPQPAEGAMSAPWRWLFAAGLVALPAATRADDPGPLAGVPAAWVGIELVGVDSWMGAYHDSLSGVLVDFDIPAKELGASIDGPVNWPPNTVMERAKRSGIPYRLSFVKDARQFVVQSLVNTFGEGLDIQWADERGLLPVAGAARLEVEFALDGVPWHFAANIHEPTQEARVRELLLQAATLNPGAAPRHRAERGTVSRKQVSAVSEGAAVRETLRRLGVPESIRRRAPDAFILEYAADGGGLAQLSFDRRQRLTSLKMVTR